MGPTLSYVLLGVQGLQSRSAEHPMDPGEFESTIDVAGRTREGVARQLHSQVARLYGLFAEAGDHFPIYDDVPDLDAVGWGQLADLVTIDKDHRWTT